jgi:hypothetical protein
VLLPADHETFESADAGASLTYPQQAGTIRKNGHIVIKGRPCKVGATAQQRARVVGGRSHRQQQLCTPASHVVSCGRAIGCHPASRDQQQSYVI